MKYTIKDDKVFNEQGQVAIAISPNFGAGWSTWSDVSATDARYNILILNGDIDAAVSLADAEGLYSRGLYSANIVWREPGTQFRITEYDGYESIKYNSDDYWEIV